MLPILQIGPFAVQTFGLVTLLSLWGGIWLSEKYAEKFKVSSEVLDKVVLYSLLSSVLAARLFYFIRYPSAFMKSPLNIFALSVQMMDWQGGILAGILIFLILVQRKQMNVWQVLDALSPLLAAAGIGAGLATLAVGSQYGTPTNLFWGIKLWGEVRHPVQIYQAAGFVLILVLLLRHLKNLDVKEETYQKGIMFLWTLIGSMAWMIFIDAFRQDTVLIFEKVHALQIIYFVILLLAIFQINALYITKDEKGDANEGGLIDESGR